MPPKNFFINYQLIANGDNMSIHIFEKASQILKEERKIALCTVVKKVGSGPREKGAKMLVTEDGITFGTIGGGTLERKIKEEALKAIKEGKSKSLRFALYEGAKEKEVETGLWCGGEMTVFIDVNEPKPRMIIVGSGHIALPTYKIADLLGFNVTVVDDDSESLTKDRFPNAKRVYNKEFEEALKEARADKDTYVVIVHGEPKHDLAALRNFIHKEAAYLGILGSHGKLSRMRKILKEESVPEERIERICAPIGLEIGAETPEEIAVSIIAEIIREKSKSKKP